MPKTIELPSQGCNVFYGDYIDNYQNNLRTRYYFNYDHLVEQSQSTYSRLPDGAYCLQEGDIYYKPETQVYFEWMAIIGALFLIFAALRLILYRFWRKIR